MSLLPLFKINGRQIARDYSMIASKIVQQCSRMAKIQAYQVDKIRQTDGCLISCGIWSHPFEMMAPREKSAIFVVDLQVASELEARKDSAVLNALVLVPM